ncbi:MAG: hypothetical protein ACJ72W_10150 [Actinoallomurus sp.]
MSSSTALSLGGVGSKKARSAASVRVRHRDGHPVVGATGAAVALPVFALMPERPLRRFAPAAASAE